MVVDESLISTGVDNLLRLVYSKGRVSLADAARELGIPSATLEEWARVLEEEGIIHLEYQLTTIFLVWAGTPKEEVAERREELLKKRASLADEVELLLGRAREKGIEIEAAKAGLEKLPAIISQQVAVVKQRFERMQAIEKESEKFFGRYAQSISRIKEGLASLGGELEKAEARSKELAASLTALEERLNASFPKFVDLKREVEGMAASLAAAERESGKLAELLAELRKAQAEARESISAFSKQLSKDEASLKELTESKAAFAASLKSMQADFEKLSKAYEANLAALELAGKRIAAELESSRNDLKQALASAEEMLKAAPVGKKLEEIAALQKELESLARLQKELVEKSILLKADIEALPAALPESALPEGEKKIEAAKAKLLALKTEEEAFERKRRELIELIRRMSEK
ncbi:MAG: hypothetical protein QXG98_04860 [Candidatus Micrarchaeia archaeon]